MSDVFGDLREWGDVLTTLQQLTDQGRLDDHQHGLARLVRFRDNWRLQEAALECALKVECSCDLLLADTLNALVCRDTPLMLRITAARATGHLLACYSDDGQSPFDVYRAYQTLEQVAAQPQPPILADALREALDKAGPAMERGLRP
jgi:hypothetical protein